MDALARPGDPPVAALLRGALLQPRVPAQRHREGAVLAEENHAAHGWHLPPQVGAHDPQGLQVAAAEGAEGCKRLGSRSEVDGFLAEARKRLLVEPTRTYTPAAGPSRIR